MNETDLSLQQRLRTLRIIAAALLGGSVVFLVVVVYLVQSNGPTGARPADAPPIITYIALGMLVMNAVMAFVVPPTIERGGMDRLASTSAPKGDDLADLLNVYQTSMIVGMALFEGAAFFGCIAFLLEGHPLALVAALGGIVGILARFPTGWRLTSWLNERRQLVASRRARPAGPR